MYAGLVRARGGVQPLYIDSGDNILDRHNAIANSVLKQARDIAGNTVALHVMFENDRSIQQSIVKDLKAAYNPPLN